MSRNQLGKVNFSVYGTRDATTSWQDVLVTHLVGLGFVRGKAHLCMLIYPDLCILATAHGDNYLSAGEIDPLTWREGKLSGKYEIKAHNVRPFSKCIGGGQAAQSNNQMVKGRL